MSTLKDKVRRLERKYEKSNNKLRQFEDENIEFMEELQELSILRNAALQELESAVRESKIEAAGMKVSISVKREFCGKALYDHLTAVDPKTRDQLIKVEYKVINREFESMLAQGIISHDLAETVTMDEKEVVTVRRKPLPYQFG